MGERLLKVFLIAGEASGDKLGAAAMRGLKGLANVEFQGVGGTLMSEEGLESQFPMSELSLMGLFEVLPKYFHLKRRIKEVAQAILKWQPDVVVTIDSPDFCLRVADIVKANSNIRICHYVAPTVWAWRPERAQKMAKKVDQVLALFPFEPPFFEKVGLRCDFVGHPVVSEEIADEGAVQSFRDKYDLKNEKLILVLPGSRRGEINRLSPCFGRALESFLKEHPDAKVVVPEAQSQGHVLKEQIQDWRFDPIVIAAANKEDKRAAFRSADVALAASGTVSLELSANQTPMVIAYKMNWLTQIIVERKLLIDTVTLVNLVTKSRVVPEFLAKNCTPQNIARSLNQVLSEPDSQMQALDDTMRLLGQGDLDPGIRAAQAILAGLER